ncbi:MAG: protein kinase [Planctomycetota bacterium]
MSSPPADPSIRLGPYTLLAKLGQGGMGEVHLAHDTRLERKVALKLLPEELRADPERRARFLREARAVAQLSHPNITQIFDVGEVDGRDYIAFELVDGRTLQEHIAARPLTLIELVELALPLADAIAYAHERGIVHRDLKPANVMITPRGHAKLLDFGLAKILHEGTRAPESKQSTTLTLQGAIFGTPGAMSPEQALGQPVDARSDLFSFGSLLYEMAAARPAFQGATVMEIMDAVIHREPDPLGRLRPDLPPEFVACVAKAQRKELGERYQTMNDLAADLRHFKRTTDSGLVPPAEARGARRSALAALVLVALGALGWIGWRRLHSGAAGAPSSASERTALAVLPFTNLGAAGEDASFAAGLHSDVLTRLAKIGALKVIARSSLLEYADTQKPLHQIGEELGAGAILSGEVRRAGHALRLNLTLHDARSEDNLWAESFDRELSSEDLFAVQGEIAEAVAAALRAKLSPAYEQRLRSVPTTSDEAYEAYLAGQVRDGNGDESWLRGIAFLEASVTHDPRFALAWAELAEARGSFYWLYHPEQAELLASAFDAARRALELEPGLAEGHLRLGSCHYYSRDYEAAEREFELAEAGLPNSTELMLSRSSLFRRIGRWDESRAQLERALEISPREKNVHWSLAISLLFLGRYDESLRHMELQRALLGGEDASGYEWVLMTNRDGRVPSEAFERPLKAKDLQSEQAILRWRLRLMTHDFAAVPADLAQSPERISNQWHDYPRALLLAIGKELAGEEAAARELYESAHAVVLAQIRARPDDARLYAPLGLTLAGLGQHEEALREARRATELMPVEHDSVVGGGLLLDRFYTELRVGALDEAVRTLADYLARPRLFALRALVLDPRLDALVGHVGFEELRRREGH